MKKVKIHTLRKGDIFHLRDNPDSPMWIKGEWTSLEYRRGDGRYFITNTNDSNHTRNVRKELTVYID